jgi:Na+-translocating ferredoxin:NAD+ oxidoreductase subunit B
MDVGVILDALPQAQCTRCGFPDCASYAKAIAQGQAEINQCPPGGAEGISRLALVTNQAEKASLKLNPGYGTEGPRVVVWIEEDACIGCTLCMKACPVDAIVGANKKMHTVVEDSCTGCELCMAVCPVDCIKTENLSGAKTGWSAWSQTQANQARQAYSIHQQRASSTL